MKQRLLMGLRLVFAFVASAPIASTTTPFTIVFNIRDYGAIETKAIQKTIDA